MSTLSRFLPERLSRGFAAFLPERFLQKQHEVETRPPTVAWLLAHRDELQGKRARCGGATPAASLNRMYEYLVIGYTAGLRTEIEYFFNHPTWAVSAIPDPMDPDPERYAILAVLPYYLVLAFNRLIERGLPRGSPAIIAGDAAEDELRAREVVPEVEPSWAARVPPLEQTLTIPNKFNKEPEEQFRSKQFLAKNIVVETPHVLFV